MDIQANHLLTEAMKLSPIEREDLAIRLLKSVEHSPGEAPLDPEWDAEIARRVDDLVSGRVRGVPAEELHRDMRERLGE